MPEIRNIRRRIYDALQEMDGDSEHFKATLLVNDGTRDETLT